MKIEVVTPDKAALSTDSDELVAPGVRGEFGILPGHTPFVSALKPGVLVARKGQKRQVFAVGAGFAEVDGHDKIVVLTQNAVPAEEVDSARAQKDLEEAERALKEGKADASALRDWAQARLDARNATR
jgi:F-type H+-transporting ATPase subunit epsilon